MTPVRGNPERRWSPTVRRQRLAHVLAQLRDKDGRSAADIAAQLGVAESTVTRLENPKHLTLPKHEQIKKLLDLYNADNQTRERVRTLVDEARQRDWWHPYKSHIPPALTTFLGLTAETAMLRIYQPTLIPGILQTPAYASGLLADTFPGLSDDKAAEFAAERRRHEEHLVTGPDPVQLRVVLGEATLHNQVGSPKVMAEQLDHLHQAAQLPNVVLEVVPFRASRHGGTSPFTILQFPEPTDPEIAYLPDPLGGHWVRNRGDVDRLLKVFLELTTVQPDLEANLQAIITARDAFCAAG